MAWDWKIVPSLAGGLNLSGHPAAIDDSQWTYGDGFFPQQGWVKSGPRYNQTHNTSWGVGYGPMGIVPNPFSLTAAALVVTSNGAGTAAGIKLYTHDLVGSTTTQVTWSGADSSGGAQDVDTGHATTGNGLITSAFLNGYVVVCVGSGSAGTYSLLRWNGTGSYTSIKDAGIVGLRGEMVTSFGNHLVLIGTARTGAGGRTLRISEVNSTDTWLPAISNSADSVVVDDAVSGFNGAARVAGNALALYTRSGTYQLTPTGGIPPFTLNFAGGPGMLDYQESGSTTVGTDYWQYGCETPYGPLTLGPDDVYLGQQSVGAPVLAFLRANLSYARPWVWHPGRGMALIPLARSSGGTTGGILAYSPTTQTWNYTHGIDAVSGQTVAWSNGSTSQAAWIHAAIASDGSIHAEDTDATLYYQDAKLDTKDFTFGAPPMDAYISEVRVEWESFGGRLLVYGWARNELNYGAGYAVPESTFTPTWTLLGTLLDGSPSLPVRLRGKYFRFRLQEDTGNGVRIRGMALRYQPATDRSYPL